MKTGFPIHSIPICFLLHILRVSSLINEYSEEYLMGGTFCTIYKHPYFTLEWHLQGQKAQAGCTGVV